MSAGVWLRWKLWHALSAPMPMNWSRRCRPISAIAHPQETLASEVLGALAEIRLTKGKIKGWAKPKRPPLFSGLPGGRIYYQPKGVVGIMGAWNYPVMLVLSPLIGAISRQPRHDQAAGHDAAYRSGAAAHAGANLR